MNSLYLLVGPSGVGKDSVYEGILAIDKISRLTSHTTRPARPSETSGVKYHFVTPDEFKTMVDDGEFIEHATVHGNFYGVNRKSLEAQLARGDVLHIIDYQGAETLKNVMGEHVVVIGLYPPSMAELERRLTKRGDTDPATIASRMVTAVTELEALSNGLANYRIVNDSLETAIEHARKTIHSHGLSKAA